MVKSSIKLYLSIILISLVFIFKELVGINVNTMILVGLISFLTILLPYSQAKAFVFFILPFTSSISGVSVLCMLVILLLKNRYKCLWQFIPAILIILLELFNVAFYTFAINYESIISYAAFISLFFFLLFDQGEDSNILLCIRMFCIGVALLLILVFASMIIQNGFAELLTGKLRYTVAMGYEELSDANGKLTLNANTIAYYSIVLLSILILGYKQLHFNKVFFYICLCVTIFAGLLSFSRTWLLLASLIFIIYIIISKQRLYIILGGILLCVTLLVTQQAVLSAIYDVFIGRMNSETMEDAGGRIPIFIEYNEFWITKIHYMLFGTGATHYSHVVPIEYSMHCGSQQVWILHGICGVLIYLFSIIRYSQYYLRYRKPIIYYIPFITCLIFDQSVQFLVPYSLMFPFIPVAYVLRIRDTITKSNK